MHDVCAFYRFFEYHGIGLCGDDFIARKRSVNYRSEIERGDGAKAPLILFVSIAADNSDVVSLRSQLAYQIISSDGRAVIWFAEHVANNGDLHTSKILPPDKIITLNLS